MGELRKDYLCDSWVLIAPVRAKRPSDFKQLPPPPTPADSCFFCPGKEHMTPPEIGRQGEPWTMRWFRNKFPAVEQQGEAIIKTDNTYFTYSGNFGIHEIIVETSKHNEQLADLSVETITKLLGVYIERLVAVSKEPHIEYVTVFKNHGPHAGTSVYHSHSQIISINFIPPYIRELHQCSIRDGVCQLCAVIANERTGVRLIMEQPHAIAFAPYASQFGFESWIFPTRHISDPGMLSAEELWDIALCLKRILTALQKLNASYNIALIYGTKDLEVHPHFRIYPRLGVWGGFELGSRVIINGVLPEMAAAYYRDPHD